jgi:hypothetical protein
MKRMSSLDVKEMTDLQVLGLYDHVLEDLWRRKIVRSGNNPCSDYAGYLVCRALSLNPVSLSKKGYDATDRAGKRYEIKARRKTSRSKPTRLSVIRDLDKNLFDYLVVVLFRHNFTVERAAVIPRPAVHKIAFFQEYVNGWIPILNDDLWRCRGAKDITTELRGLQRGPAYARMGGDKFREKEASQ